MAQIEQRTTGLVDASRTPAILWWLRVTVTTTWPGRRLEASMRRHLVEISKEDLAVSGCLDGHDGQHAGVAHPTQDGEHVPVAAGHRVVHPLAARCTRIQPGHLCAHTALVQIDQVLGRYLRDPLDKGFAAKAVGFGVTLV